MRLIDPIIQELEAEAKVTERVLARVPEAELIWKPHPKSMSLGHLALHIANIPGFIARASLDDGFEPRTSPPPAPQSQKEILDAHHRGLETAREALNRADDAMVLGTFNLMKDGQVLRTFPRMAVYRNFMLKHVAHHRGQLTVYLRLLNVAVPSVYGPSAEEAPVF